MRYALRVLFSVFILFGVPACGGGGGGTNGTLPSMPVTRPSAAPAPAATSAPAPSSVHITEIPTPQALQGGIVVGSDGAVYMNGVTAFIRYSGSFATYAYTVPDQGPFAGIFAQPGVNTIVRGPGSTIWAIFGASTACCGPFGLTEALLPTSGSVSEGFTTLFDDSLISIAAGPAGEIWVIGQPHGLEVAGAEPDYIVALDSAQNPITTSTTPDFTIFAMVLGPDNKMYVASDPANALTPPPGEPSQIFQLDASSANTLHTTTLPTGSSVTQMAAGPDSAIWFTDTGLNKIGRLTTSGTVTYFSVPTPNSGLSGIAGASDNAMWFTETSANKIGRIDTSGHITEYTVPTPNAHPVGIDAGAPGGCVPQTIYFTEANALGKITFSQ